MNYIGIDNGVTGSIGIINSESITYIPTPVKRVLNYTKAKQFLNRIDGKVLTAVLEGYAANSFCLIERPMINPARWIATISAIRALESTQTILELLKIPYQFIDSKEWQKSLLPSGLEKEELKFASLEVGQRLFPSISFTGFKDADGLLIAEHARRKYGGGEKNLSSGNVMESTSLLDKKAI